MFHNSKRGSIKALIAALGASLLLTSCMTTQEINDQYEYYYSQLQQILQAMIEACQGTSDPQACEDDAVAWYNQRLQELNDGHQEAIDENWEDAYERRKEWERKLRETLPNWPDIQEGILPALLGDEWISSISMEAAGGPDPCEDVVRMVSAFREDYESIDLQTDPELLDMVEKSPCFVTSTINGGLYAQAVSGEMWTVDGTISLDQDGTIVGADATGSLGLVPFQSGTGWSVVSGSISLSTGGNRVVSMNVVSDPNNLVEIGPDGTGTITALFTNYYANEVLRATLLYFNRIQLPVTLDPDGTIHINEGWAPVEDYVPHSPWPASDYNQDGVLDYASDHPAFMAGYNLQEALADQNVDGVWDQSDIDLWTDHFWTDYAEAQP